MNYYSYFPRVIVSLKSTHFSDHRGLVGMNRTRFLQIFKCFTPELLKILTENVIGTPGLSMRYRHLEVADKAHRIAQPYIVSLMGRNSVLGTACFCKRNIVMKGRDVTIFYIRYFTFRESYRRKKIGGRKKSTPSDLRKEVHELLNGAGFELTTDSFFHYAYVDPRNERSVLLCKEFGFKKVREYATIIFNRLRPVFHSIQKVGPDEEQDVRQLVADFYKEYTMFSDENIFRGRAYYVIKDQSGTILAGVSVSPDRWEVLELPGKFGLVFLRLCSCLPFLNRVINSRFNFLALDGIYCKTGQESKLEELLESLLYQYKVHSALAIADVDSALYRTLKSLQLGATAKLSKEVRGDVIVWDKHIEESLFQQLVSQPAYISGIDVT